MRHFLSAIFLGITVFSLPISASADLKVEFEVRLERTIPPNGNGGKEKRDEPKTNHVVIQFGTDYAAYDDGESAELINFGTRQIFYRNKKTHQYSEAALIAQVGFLSAEFTNRMAIAGALGAAGLKDNPMDKLLTEHLFSIRAKDSAPLKSKVSGNTQAWQSDGKMLFAEQTTGFALSTPETAQFVRLLRHRFGIHPDILDSLTKQQIIPREFEVYRYNIRVDHFSLRLVNCERTPVAIDQTDFLEGTTKKNNPVTPLILLADKLDATGFKAACDQLHREALTQKEAGKTFEAVLLLLEYGLCTDQLQPAEIAAFKDDIQKDIRAQVLFSSLNPTSKESAEMCVKNLLSLESKTGVGKGVLEIFRRAH